MLSRMKWILAQKPDVVILETGANEEGHTIIAETVYPFVLQALQVS